MADTNQTPFPYSIIEGSGMGYALGLLGSGPYHLFKGPKTARFSYATMKAPKTAGSFAAWGGLFDATSGVVAHVRRKEDPWNSIWAGGLSSGLLSWRKGPITASRQFFVGAALLAGAEGAMIAVARLMAKIDALEQGHSDRETGDYKDDIKISNRYENDIKILNSYDNDTSPPDVPNFEIID